MTSASGLSLQSPNPSDLAAIALLAFAVLHGGWPWVLMAVVLVVTYRIRERDSRSMLQAAAVGLFWLSLFHWTGDRRLFFPFSMQVAASVACLWRLKGKGPALAGGALVTAAFAVIRIVQSAGAHVLGVELVVAATVICVGLSLLPCAGSSAASTASALLALAGLLI